MEENTNKAIAVNTIVLYTRLIIITVCGLLSTRYALLALGVDDFGVFSVVGGIISFIAIINTVMVSTSNRYLAVAIGKGDVDQINKQFNVNLLIHVCIAVVVLLCSYPIGHWYINHYVHYDGNLELIKLVFDISIIGSAVSFISVPYNGLLMAKERFLVFCVTDIVEKIIKVLICYLLIYYFEHKLFIYTLTNSILTAIPTVVYFLYCTAKFRSLVSLHFVKEGKSYRDVLSFSVWVGYGAVAAVGKAQGAALIVNMFFTTAMNTALGLANTVNQMMITFANNVSKSISPQITKSYASGNFERSLSLVCFSSKMSFMFMLLISSPFLLTPNYIFTLWLGTVPEYVTIFTVLMTIDALIGTLNAGVPELIFATGNIKWYQLIVNSFFILSVIVAYFVLRQGFPAYMLIGTYIVFSIIVLCIRQIVLSKVTIINNWEIIRRSYIPSLFIIALYVPFLCLHPDLHPLVLNLMSVLYLICLDLFIGLTKVERMHFFGLIRQKLTPKSK